MTYNEVVQYLFRQVPSFQRIGKDGYKEGLENTIALDEHFHHPHKNYKTIHIAGTNGKGSTAHTIAAILQSAGYKVGLYTSPHLIDFRERIKVNGTPISEEEVIHFVEEERNFYEPLYPSFFELTTAMAFNYFKQQEVDYAVIEVGLGGRLDCTNIITPILSIITNISFDHIQYLGDSLSAIAYEKAGIIKEGIPVIIGETVPETKPVFQKQADKANAPICFAEESPYYTSDITFDKKNGGIYYKTSCIGDFYGELGGFCQEKNTNTILHAVKELQKQGVEITDEAIKEGFSHVCQLTGLQGRWQTLSTHPHTVCDTGHNEGGFAYIVQQLQAQECENLRIVFGMVSDKDISAVLKQLPQKAIYYFTQASIPRALPANELARLASTWGLKGNVYPSVSSAYDAAVSEAAPDDFIFIGGSSFVVADLLEFLEGKKEYHSF